MKSALDHLAELYGIGGSYLDYRGRPRQVTSESRAAILAAMGLESGDERAMQAAIHTFETVRWTRMLPAAIVLHEHSPAVPIAIPLDLGATRLSWAITLENGAQRSGVAALSELETVERGEVDGRTFSRCRLPAPRDLPLGYHRIEIGLDTGLTGQASLIVPPARCHESPALQEDGRAWGIAVQLYSLRSAGNWGMGDFGDLRALIAASAPLGCGLIGLNPLHALLPANPEHISPYSPSNRQFLNVLYIAVADVPEFHESTAAQELVAGTAFQSRLTQLRATKLVDYAGVAAVKFEVLRMLYQHFRATHLSASTPRAAAFRQYVEERGESLRLHAVFDALDAHLRMQGPQYCGWPSWPDEYRDPMSAAVNRFARERVQDVEYFLYLQWLVEGQLCSAQQLARDSGMSIGLYGDVAVGANPGGSETWANRHLYVHGASIGAPPDALALKGQDWGIPPQNPAELRLQAYQPFVAMIRNNMRPVAALRLDHVMSLFRLWWVPGGLTSAGGAYVHYPLEDLLAILALESVRHHCVVIGEDLGTVPEEVRAAMERYELNHYKVLLFEKEFDGSFRAPSKYARNALATVTTHDLPTLRGWWESHDIALRDRLNLYPSREVRDEVHRARDEELPAMMSALVAQGLWHWLPTDGLPAYSPALARAIQAYLGLSSSKIVMIQIEDLLGMADPVNVPGTDREHANWQRKVALETQETFARADVRDILNAVSRARRGENPNS